MNLNLLNSTPEAARMGRWSHLPAWFMLPLRGFLGITFIYAGLQKIFDPQFFNDASHGSIKYQLEIFAHSSPLKWLLTSVAIPHADFFGWLIALGELWVGIATLLGVFTRLSALAGCFISALLWMTATWNVSPYFLGSDSIYAMAWLTLALAGYTDYSVDQWLALRRQQDNAALAATRSRTRQHPHTRQRGQSRATAAAAPSLRGPADVRRRDLLRMTLAGGAVLSLGAIGAVFVRLVEPVIAQLRAERRRLGGGDDGGSANNPTPVPTQANGAIGNTSQVPVNSALSFTLASNGDPGVVVHLSQNKYVAFDATCTHAGCTVNYDPSTQALICPCHGAAFDPANNAAVLGGPTNQPLTSVPITIDGSGNIFVSG